MPPDAIEMLREFIRLTEGRNGADAASLLGVNKSQMSKYRTRPLPKSVKKNTRLKLETALRELRGGVETVHNVSRETRPAPLISSKATTVFVGHVLHASGQIARLALSIVADAQSQIELSNELSQAAVEQPAPSREVDPMIYGANIYARRNALNMSPAELAKLVHWQSGVDVEQVEAGGYKWNVDEAERAAFAKALQTDVATLCAAPSRSAAKPRRKGSRR